MEKQKLFFFLLMVSDLLPSRHILSSGINYILLKLLIRFLTFCVSYLSTNKTFVVLFMTVHYTTMWCLLYHSCELSQDEDPETSWMLLSEDDLVSLFSQFPFDELFKHLLGICSKGGTLIVSHKWAETAMQYSVYVWFSSLINSSLDCIVFTCY